ncbi:MAG TPA: hypothetical protein VHE30_26905 [Polyangiaceae bacterium]|nr:hypothetical protein [Polyangiaceae bacterium]
MNRFTSNAVARSIGLLLVVGGCAEKDADETRKGIGAPSASDAGESAELGAPLEISITVPGVQPGEEGTKCLQLPLGNTEAVAIGKIENTLSTASHHLVVSAVNDPAEVPTDLFDCRPFKAVLIGAPLTVTQKHDDVITMPRGVGFPLAANQLMHLEMHYINTGNDAVDVVAKSALYPLRDSENVQEASFIIVGNLDIQIPPHAEHENPPAYVSLPPEFASANFYAATGHTHRFGTRARLATAANETDPGTVIYDPPGFSWTEAELKRFDPPFRVPSGGGFRFNCAWNNTTDETVTYGESALQEMCFFWTYYYPRIDGRRTLITGFENSPYAKHDAGAAKSDAGLAKSDGGTSP